MRSVIHYSGGLEAQLRTYYTIRLRGWAACCSGDRALRIAQEGRQTLQREQVTCRACLRLIEAAAR